MKGNKATGVYVIVNNSNGKRYVGSTASKGGFNRRFIVHLSDLNKNKHHSQYLQRSWNKYGSKCFSFIIIEECDSDLAINVEQYWINLLRPEYNSVMVAHSNLGYKKTPEQLRRQSEAFKGRVPWNKGRKTGSYYKKDSFIKRKNTLEKNGNHSGRPPIKIKLIDTKTGDVFVFNSASEAGSFCGIKNVATYVKKGYLIKSRYKALKIDKL